MVEAARQFYDRGAFPAAIHALRQLPASEQAEEDAQLLLGACLGKLRRNDEAVSAFAGVLAINPDRYEALTWLGVLKKNHEGIEEALRCALRAVELKPQESEGHGVLGACYLYLRQPAEAVASFERAVSLAPEVAQHWHNLGLGCIMAREKPKAIQSLRRAIELAPRDVQSYVALAGEYVQYGIVDKCIEVVTEGLAAVPNSAALHSLAAAAFASIRNDPAAERHYKRAIELSPSAKTPFAAWLLNQGRFPEANSIYDVMLQDKTSRPFGYYGLMLTRKLTAEDAPFVSDMERLLEDVSIGPAGELRIRYALGRAHEQLGNYETAIKHYDAANVIAYRIHHAGYPFNPANYRIEREQQQLFQESIENVGSDSDQPIFIVGMIRSGTTLLDQILTSHPSVAGAGELRYWIEEGQRVVTKQLPLSKGDLTKLADEYPAYARLLAGDSQRFTDKMPLNTPFLGLIHAALPNARILHIRRHPVDTCLSIYTTYFGNGAQFAYNRNDIVAYYREYLESMRHWRTHLPQESLLELDYEELITDAEGVTRRILDFCGLQWDDACLRHHQNRSAINTPSRWQARQPIYNSSVERWKRYEPWLGEFRELL